MPAKERGAAAMRLPLLAKGPCSLFFGAFGQAENAPHRFLNGQIARWPNIGPSLCEHEINFRAPAADAANLGEQGNGVFVIRWQMREIDRAIDHQFGKAAGIALFLAAEAAGA